MKTKNPKSDSKSKSIPKQVEQVNPASVKPKDAKGDLKSVTLGEFMTAINNLSVKVEALEKEADVLAPKIKTLEKEIKDANSFQDKMTAKYENFTSANNEMVSNLIKNVAFADGIKSLITMAENNLAKSLKLNDRNDLSQNGQLIPGWWMVTLFQCNEYLPKHKPVKDDEVKT